MKASATLLAFHIFYEVVLLQAEVSLNLFTWKPFGFEAIQFNFIFDPLSVSKKNLVFFITTLVKIYSLDYKANDPHLARFISLLGLFSFSKLTLLLADNIIVLFLGWEKVGVVSYLLVNFWFTRLRANQSALKALFKNKIGDAALVIGAVIISKLIGDVNYSTVFSVGYLIDPQFLYWALIAFVVAAGAKSALVGLHSWLPSAKEGPTPVSALLHSATKVTAGVFLTIRFSPLIEEVSFISHLILVLGSITAILGASSALVSQDLKKVVAYSTSSQLGYKIVCCGISLYNLGLFHLLNHAFFKSLLFLASGAVLHAVNDNQDIRRKGSIVLHLPLTYTAFFLASFSLIAFPFFTGFYSKDFLLTLLLIPHSTTSSAAYVLTLLAAVFTSLYSLRILKITFLSNPNFNLTLVPYVTDGNALLSSPLFILSIFAVAFGYLTQYIYLDFGLDSYLNSIFIHPSHNFLLDGSLSQFSLLKLLPLALLLLFPLIIIKLPSFFPASPLSSISPQSPIITNLSLLNSSSLPATSSPTTSSLPSNPTQKFYFFGSFHFYDVLLHSTISSYFKLSLILYRYFDKGLLELLGPNGISRLIHFTGFFLELTSTSYLLHYFFFLLAALFLFFSFSIFTPFLLFVFLYATL